MLVPLLRVLRPAHPSARPAPAPAPAIGSHDAGRVPELDGLRGIAVLWVIVTHAVGMFPLDLRIPQSLSAGRKDGRIFQWLCTGSCGVDLFFVLSGFLITGILLRSRGKPGYYASFYARRTLRIMPLYYAVVLARGLLSFTSVWWLRGLDTNTYLANWFFAGNVWQSYAQSFGPSKDDWTWLLPCWSLAVEEQFYLLWPLVVARTNPRVLGMICAAAIPAAVACREGFVLTGQAVWCSYALTPCRMDGLCFGALVAIAAHSGVSLAEIARKTRLLALAALAGVAFVVWKDHGPSCHGRYMQIGGYTCVDALFAWLLCWVLGRGVGAWQTGLLRTRPLQVFGAYSYAMYLLHLPMAFLALWVWQRPEVRDWAAERIAAMDTAVPMALCYTVMVLVMSVVAGWLSWHLLEKRCLALKRFFPSKG